MKPKKVKWKLVEVRGIDPRTSRMKSERSTIWATPRMKDDTIGEPVS